MLPWLDNQRLLFHLLVVMNPIPLKSRRVLIPAQLVTLAILLGHIDLESPELSIHADFLVRIIFDVLAMFMQNCIAPQRPAFAHVQRLLDRPRATELGFFLARIFQFRETFLFSFGDHTFNSLRKTGLAQEMHEADDMKIEPYVGEFLKNRFKNAPLRIVLWNGRQIELTKNPTLTLSLTTPSAVRYLLRPSFRSLGEAYIEGKIHVEGSPSEILKILEETREKTAMTSPLAKWTRKIRPRPHSRRADEKAIRFHYDVSNDFYRLWLDQNMIYSCAYFKDGEDDLDRAQEQKLDHICRKLMLKPGERFLDIGCGWGGLIRWAAKNYGVKATGITLSENQYDYARDWIREEKLEDHCEVLLCDYRDLKEKDHFDKISSVGMFEHVGIANYPIYFGNIHRLLKEGGLILNHGICSSSLDLDLVPGDGGEFMDRYVFPGQELPHVSRVTSEISRQKMEVTDVESLRPHYAKTLRHWLARLEKNQAKIEAIVGDRRYRIWRAYLMGTAHAFDRGWISIYQVLAVKHSDHEPWGNWRLPWTRSHIYKE